MVTISHFVDERLGNRSALIGGGLIGALLDRARIDQGGMVSVGHFLIMA